MSSKELITESRAWFDRQPVQVSQPLAGHVFESGAQWMHARMNELSPDHPIAFDESISFTFYGILKYGSCLTAFLFSGLLLFHIHLLLLPISVFIFYWLEVHFLFLFPLLIDRVSNPIRTSIRVTYRIGIVRCMATVMQIAFFMVIGLFNFRNPFQNWHIGCLSILIWYENDVRNRL